MFDRLRKFATFVKASLVLAALLFINVLLGNMTYESVFPSSYRVVQKVADLPAFKTNDITRNSEKKKEALIRLHEDSSDEQDRFFCSAFVVSDKYAITAAHCLVDSKQKLKTTVIKVHPMPDATKTTLPYYGAEAVAINITSDLGLIRGDFKQFNKILVDPTPSGVFKAKGPLVTCGFPYGDTDLCTPFQPQGPAYNFIFGGGFIYPGMSGGPVIDLSTLTVIGVNSAITNGAVIIAPLIGLFNDAGVKVE